MHTKTLISRLIIFGLVLTPIFGIQDWLEVLPIFNRYVDFGFQVAIKATKDILLVTVFVLFVLDVLSGRPFLRDPLVWLMVSIIGIAFIITCMDGSPFLGLIGVRSFSPLLLIFIAYAYLDVAFLRKVMRVLLFLFVLECCAAGLQIFLGVPISGCTYFGLAARPFGTFGNPWSLAVFICCVVCFRVGWDVHVYGRPRQITWIFVGVSSFLVFLIQSGAGILALSVILISYFLFLSRQHPYAKASVTPALVLIPALAFYNLAWLTGRPCIYSSVRTRLAILTDLLGSMGSKDILIGRGMGVGSNAAVVFTNLSSMAFGGSEKLFISDSLYTAFISQAGIILLMVFIAFNI